MSPKVFTDSELSELIRNAEDASRLKEASHRANDALDRLSRLNKEFTTKLIKEYLGYLTPIKYDNKETNIIDQYFKDMVDIQIMVCDIKNDCDIKLDNIAQLVNKRVLELKDRK